VLAQLKDTMSDLNARLQQLQGAGSVASIQRSSWAASKLEPVPSASGRELSSDLKDPEERPKEYPSSGDSVVSHNVGVPVVSGSLPPGLITRPVAGRAFLAPNDQAGSLGEAMPILPRAVPNRHDSLATMERGVTIGGDQPIRGPTDLQDMTAQSHVTDVRLEAAQDVLVDNFPGHFVFPEASASASYSGNTSNSSVNPRGEGLNQRTPRTTGTESTASRDDPE